MPNETHPWRARFKEWLLKLGTTEIERLGFIYDTGTHRNKFLTIPFNSTIHFNSVIEFNLESTIQPDHRQLSAALGAAQRWGQRTLRAAHGHVLTNVMIMTVTLKS